MLCVREQAFMQQPQAQGQDQKCAWMWPKGHLQAFAQAHEEGAGQTSMLGYTHMHVLWLALTSAANPPLQ